jgi:hypothetical protein
VVLGNPPWEVVQLGEEEYFATRAPEIAALPGATRKRAIAALEREQPDLFEAYRVEKRRFEATNEFARAGGRFIRTARGKVNTYALFAELFLSLTRPNGRAGIITPTGIATDATTAPFFGYLVEQARLAGLADFENRAGLFPDVDSRMKFCLLTLGLSESSASFSFFLTDVAQLADVQRRFALSPADIARINPNTKTMPVFRARADAELTARIYGRVPVLIEEGQGTAGNPWRVEFRQGLFNMTSDSSLFRTAAQLAALGLSRNGRDWMRAGDAPTRQAVLALTGGRDAGHLDLSTGRATEAERWVPLYEAKMIHHYDHRWATYDGADSRDVTLAEKADPAFEPAPRYWVSEHEVTDRLAEKGWRSGWLMGWRDICRATDERTVIASLFPRSAVGHTSPLFFLDAVLPLWPAFYASLSSLILDFVARQKVGGTHLTYGYLNQFSILPPDAYDETALAFIAPRVLELTYTSHTMAPFARDLGHTGTPFKWDEDRRAHLRAELDAWYAHAYGLTRNELRYVLDPKGVMGGDYPSETFRVLQANERKRYGEYRTARLVLAAYDAMRADGTAPLTFRRGE